MAVPGEEYARRYRRIIIFASLALICAVPGLFYLLGFQTPWEALDYEGILIDATITEPEMPVLQALMQGATAFSLWAWTTVCLTMGIAVLSFAHYSVKYEPEAPVISMAAFWAGTVTAFNLLAFHGFGLQVLNPPEFLHFNWTLMQGFTALLLIGGGIFVLYQERFPEPTFRVGHLLWVAVGMALLAYVVIFFTAHSANFPLMGIVGKGVPRPANLIPLVLFVFAALVVFPKLDSMCKSPFSFALWLSAVPLIASQIYMAFFSVNLFDWGFHSAQLNRSLAFGILFGGLVKDYTDVCRAESRLRGILEQTQHQTRMLIDNAIEAVVVFGPARRVYLWNPRAEELFGVSEREARGRDVVGLLFPNGCTNGAKERFLKQLELCDESDEPEMLQRRLRMVMRTEEDEERALEYSLISAQERDGRRIFAFLARDISEQESLQLRTIQLDRLVAVGTLAAGVAHEINNPLAYTTMNIEVARESIQQIDHHVQCFRHQAGREPELRRFIERFEEMADMVDESDDALSAAQEGAGRVLQIAGDMRFFSHVTPDELRQVSVERPLDVAVRMTRGEVRRLANIELHVDSVSPVLADETRLSQVFVNLIMNAAQAMERVPRRHHRLKIEVFEEGEQVVVRFVDTGPGMSEKLIREIFNPFFTTKPAGKGTGLGLSLSRTIVEELGGTLEVESWPGEGSAFCVRLPKAKALQGGPEESRS